MMGLPESIYDAAGLAVRLLILNASGRQVDLSTAPRLLTGADAPTSTAYPAGSLYLRQNGGIYAYDGSAWALLEASSGPSGYRALGTPGAIGSSYAYTDLTTAGTYTLPTPTSGLRLDVGASVSGVTIDAGAGVVINAARTYSLSQWESITLIGTGSNWRIY